MAAVGLAVPPLQIEQELAKDILANHFSRRLSAKSMRLVKKVFAHPSIMRRHFAVDQPETILNETADERVARFTKWSVRLAAEAVQKAVRRAGHSIVDLHGLVVNTCTGYICPGISTYLLERLELPANTRLFDLVGGGCGGAIPNLQLCEGLLGGLSTGAPGIVVSVSVEICSATFQMADDIGLIVSNALFGDGAAAVVVSQRPHGLAMIDSASICLPNQREHIRFIHRQGQLYNQLSMSLPALVKKAVARVVSDLLQANSLRVADINHWALHTGGDKIVQVIQQEIGLADKQLEATRMVLAEYGNLSSPTVWFVLQKIIDSGRMKSGDWCLAIAFGAGLCAHAYLLKSL